MSQVLSDLGWPPGLTKVTAASVDMFPVRFVIVDNSGSMQYMDGQRLVATGGSMKKIRATRWAELGDTVNELGEVVTRLGAETHFHLLNPTHEGQYFVLADDAQDQKSDHQVGRAGASADLSVLRRAMATSPSGSTPLTEAVELVSRLVAPAAGHLRARGQQVVVVLATDGLPNDPASFVRALQGLQRLPVWLVVRLCTDEEDVVNYWGELDAQLEAPLEVLDDVAGEAREVHGKNAWLTYAPSLHLARTLGLQDKLFDLLDETPLLPSQAKQVIERVLGCAELTEPEVDAGAFFAQLKAALASLPRVYNPMSGAMAPWVDVHALQKHIRRMTGGGGGGCVVS